MKIKELILLTILSHNINSCTAQPIDSSFRPQEIVIFEDDFSGNTPGAFPKNWMMTFSFEQLNFNSKNKYYTVEQRGDTSALRIAQSNASDGWIAPAITKINYLPDSFTLEYDFMLETKSATCNLYFKYCDKCLCEIFDAYNKGNTNFTLVKGGYREFIVDGGKTEKYYESEQKIHNGCDSVTWHHFALAYYKGFVSCYIDNKFLLHTFDSYYTPKRFMLNCDQGKGAVRFTNIRLASGNYTTQKKVEDFNKLLTEKKMVTHAILFDANSTDIKPESISFIHEFAAFLKKNPKLKLEIDGHTDNDGSDSYNLQLSQKRATQVKKQLVAFGVSATRLTATGFGASKPIASNISLEGKAENRRVEFINK